MKILLLLFLGIFIGCSSSACEDRIEKEVISPLSQYKVTIFERNCGATTDFSTMVSLQKKEEKFDPDEPSRILVLKGRDTLNITWSGENSIRITGISGKIFKQVQKWNDITITFDHTKL